MRRAFAFFLLLAATACTSVLPEPETPDSLFRFDAPVRQYEIGSTLLIREPEASRLFAGRAIASEASDGSLRIVRGVEWSDRATRMMQTALLDAFRGGDGVALSSETGAVAWHELSWRLADFTLRGDEAVCRVQATLLLGHNRSVLEQYNVESRVTVGSASNAVRARALADAGRDCVQHLAQILSEKTTAPAQPD